MKISQEIKEAFFPPLPTLKRKARNKQADLFWNSHPELRSRIKPIACSRKWAYIRGEWKEKNKGSSQKISQLYPICIDRNSRYFGDIYAEDPHALLATKFGLLIIGRGLHAVFQTFYHVSMIGITVILVNGIKHKKPAAVIRQSIFRSLADIFRTPYYDGLLGATAVAALVIGVFHRAIMFECRAFTGHTLNVLYRGKREEFDGSPCMRRRVNLMSFEKNPKRQVLYADTYYENPNNLTLVGLTNFTRRWS